MTPDVPLTLWDQPHWELAGITDTEVFFESVDILRGLASTLFVEGTSPSDAVLEAFERLREPGPYLPQDQTIWPRAFQWRLPLSSSVLKELRALASFNATPELIDHLFIYSQEAALLEWADAFATDSPIYLADVVPSDTVAALAYRLGTSVERLEPGGPTTR
jgi:hypothetical protein